MEIDPLFVNLSQPTLFDLGDTSTGALELFPAVWSAAEGMTFSDVNARRSGLERLVALGAARLSPLVAYLLATRVIDPDLELRTRIVRVLAGVLSPDEKGHLAPEAVRSQLAGFFTQMRTRKVYSLLQVAEHDPSSVPQIITLLNHCCHAGKHLAEILLDRKLPLAIRKRAAYFIGKVGYLNTIPSLERLESRLVARLNGQQTMSFAPLEPDDEVALLPDVQAALNLLRAP